LYNPFRNPQAAFERRNVVLQQMQKAGFLDSLQFAETSQTELNLTPGDTGLDASHDSYLRVVVEKWLETWSEEAEHDIYSDGLKIYTTIDSRMQTHAEAAMVEQMKQ